MKKINLTLLIVCIAAAELAGAIGSIFNIGAVEGWYAALPKSVLTPPPWVFGPVWTLLFLLIGISLYLAIKAGHRRFLGPKKYFTTAMIIFGVQWILNVMWSFLFFYLQEPLLAFVEIILLALSIIATMIFFYRLRPAASYILIPYLVWVCFASYLNFAFWQLNS